MKNALQPPSVAFVDFQLLFEASPEPVLALSADVPSHVVVAITDAFAESVGVAPSSMIGRSLTEVWPDMAASVLGLPSLSAVQASLVRVISSRHLESLSTPRSDGAQGYSITIAPAVARDGSIGYLLLRLPQNVTSNTDSAEQLSRYREFFHRAAVGLVVGHPNGSFGPVNPAFTRMHGYSAEELEGSSISRLFPPEELHTLEEARRRVAETGHHSWETLSIRKDGTRFPVAIDLTGVRNDQGELLYRIASVSDITERKRAEAALRDQLRLTEAITNNASASLFILDERQQCVFMNPAAERLTGYPFHQVRGRTLHEVVHHTRPDGTPYLRSECPIDRAFPEDNQVQGEEVFVHRDGSFYPVAYTASPIREGEGVVGTILEVQNIAERKQMEEALRHSRERLQQVLKQAPVAVAVLRGREMVFEVANLLYLELVPGRDVIGRTVLEVIPEVSSGLYSILQGVLDTGEPFIGHEYAIPLDRNRDGSVEEYFFTFVYHPLREAGGEVSGVVVVAVDVTAHVLARRGLERANRELEEFAYVSSHDLQEPLRMVNIFTQLLLRDLGPHLTDTTRSHAEVVRSSVKRMEQLLRDLLSFSRQVQEDTDERATDAVDLERSLNLALAALSVRIEEQSARITADPLPTVSGDESHFSQVFQNLISNALKYHKGGAPARVHVSSRLEANEWIISVHDNGIGFDQSHAGRIFGLFKRLHKNEYPGTGLGLAICKRIVERYGGRIWAESEPGQGSTFSFALPQVGIRARSHQG